MTWRQFAIRVGGTVVGGLLSIGWLHVAPESAAAAFERECARIEAGLKARVGVSVLDTATDRRLSYRGDERFPMCSTFKALLGAAVLKRVEAGEEDLNRRIHFGKAELVTYSPVTKENTGDLGMTIGELCHAAITVSDNTAANLLLKTIGGPAGVTELARSLGDDVTRLDRWEPELNEAADGDPRDTTSPDAMATSLNALVVGDALSEPSREHFVAWLVANTTGNARLRAGVPAEWRIGDKTGSGGFGTANDVAVIWPPDRKPVFVAMFVTQTAAPAAACNAAFAEVAQLVTAELSVRPVGPQPFAAAAGESLSIP
ncbi:class A beta-lactamase [soil metagenome]